MFKLRPPLPPHGKFYICKSLTFSSVNFLCTVLKFACLRTFLIKTHVFTEAVDVYVSTYLCVSFPTSDVVTNVVVLTLVRFVGTHLLFVDHQIGSYLSVYESSFPPVLGHTRVVLIGRCL